MEMSAVTPSFDPSIRTGISLNSSLSVHKKEVHLLPVDVRIFIAQALRVVGEFPYDIVKLPKSGAYVSLLFYPDFDTEPNPTLAYTIKVMPNGQFCIFNEKS